MTFKVIRTEEEWKGLLSPDRYRVLRQKGTELPFKNRFWDFDGSGTYVCAGCGSSLFSSSAKFPSRTGWPSFYQSINGSVIEQEEMRFGKAVTEVICATCGGHLGHVFDDGPPPTGRRYCVNSAAMELRQNSEE